MGELVVHLVRGFLASNKPLSRHHPRGAGLKTVFYYSAFMQFRLRSPPANLIYLKEQAKERVGLIEIVVYT